MDEIRIALDGMGGDYAPGEIVLGAVDAVKEFKQVSVSVLGDEKASNDILSTLDYDKDRLKVIPTTEMIEMAEPPVNALRSKKDSSIVRGMNLVRSGECDCFVSGGNTGAVLVGG